MEMKCRHFGSGLFKPGAYDGAGRMVVAAVLLCVGICAKGDTVTNLVEKAVQGTTFSSDGKTATIQVPSAVGAFIKVVIGVQSSVDGLP